jgi:alpha-tubulin suppressor-like RCC1 family protein
MHGRLIGALLLVALLALPARANASSYGSVTLTTSGLPSGQRALVIVRGPRFHRVIRATRTSLGNVQPGRYVIIVRPVAIARATSQVHAGAMAYPARPRLAINVKAGKVTRLTILYSAVVNPSVEPLPRGVLGFTGDPKAPSVVLLPGRMRAPKGGTIFTSGPTSALPYGLISKVTGTKHRGNKLIVSLRGVPIIAAIPELTFTGNLPLTPPNGVTQELGSGIAAQSSGAPNAHVASVCHPSSLVRFGAHLDSVELRQAFLGTWPPQMRLTLAVRSTESLGVAAAAVGINCDWTLGKIGPFQGAIPVGPVVIPIYATFPVNAGIHVNGTLNAGTINVASTTVATAAAGFDETKASLDQQGSNVWLSGAPSISGSVKLSTSIGLQAGIGIANGANVHLEADFGPELDWSSGHSCNLLLNFGSLSAGVDVFGKNLSTPSFTPFQRHLWSGCQGPTGAGGGGSGGGGSGGGGGGGEEGGGGGTIATPGAATIAVGERHTCAIVDGGHVDCWGGDEYGQLGTGSTGVSSAKPVVVIGIANAVALTTGSYLGINDDYAGGYTCALLTTGAVKCWGLNPAGLGNGSDSESSVPVAVSGISNATAVAATDGHDGGENTGGDAHTCAALATGQVMCWGANRYGQLGDGTTGDRATPVLVKGLAGAISVAAGQRFSCALLIDGSVSCWGNVGGGTANDPPVKSLSPAPMAGFANGVALSAGGASLCLLDVRGNVSCLGAQEYDIECSHGTFENCGGGTGGIGVAAALLPTALGISLGSDHLCGLQSGGSVQCGGWNGYGQLGNGAVGDPLYPFPYPAPPVVNLSNVTEVAAGTAVSCARLMGGGLDCWGRNAWGNLGDSSTIDSAVPVAVSGIP